LASSTNLIAPYNPFVSVKAMFEKPQRLAERHSVSSDDTPRMAEYSE
jgi:hypothetical protein